MRQVEADRQLGELGRLEAADPRQEEPASRAERGRADARDQDDRQEGHREHEDGDRRRSAAGGSRCGWRRPCATSPSAAQIPCWKPLAAGVGGRDVRAHARRRIDHHHADRDQRDDAHQERVGDARGARGAPLRGSCGGLPWRRPRSSLAAPARRARGPPAGRRRRARHSRRTCRTRRRPEPAARRRPAAPRPPRPPPPRASMPARTTGTRRAISRSSSLGGLADQDRGAAAAGDGVGAAPRSRAPCPCRRRSAPRGPARMHRAPRSPPSGSSPGSR